MSEQTTKADILIIVLDVLTLIIFVLTWLFND